MKPESSLPNTNSIRFYVSVNLLTNHDVFVFVYFQTVQTKYSRTSFGRSPHLRPNISCHFTERPSPFRPNLFEYTGGCSKEVLLYSSNILKATLLYSFSSLFINQASYINFHAKNQRQSAISLNGASLPGSTCLHKGYPLEFPWIHSH